MGEWCKLTHEGLGLCPSNQFNEAINKNNFVLEMIYFTCCNSNAGKICQDTMDPSPLSGGVPETSISLHIISKLDNIRVQTYVGLTSPLLPPPHPHLPPRLPLMVSGRRRWYELLSYVSLQVGDTYPPQLRSLGTIGYVLYLTSASCAAAYPHRHDSLRENGGGTAIS